MSFSSNYKPSPLSFGSPRASPFRRPESPAPSSASGTVRATTPTQSPHRQQSPFTSPSKQESPVVRREESSWTPRGLSPSPTRPAQSSESNGRARSTERGSKSDLRHSSTDQSAGKALSKLTPVQLRELRDSFQLLDRDHDGQVTRDDVMEMLKSLDQDASVKAVTTFFPPSAPQTLALPPFLTMLSNLLEPLSEQDELTSAFAAFDEDDSGVVDLAELRDALLHTAPEGGIGLSDHEIDSAMRDFIGKRTFGGPKNRGMAGPKGNVFKYRDFVASVKGGADNAKEISAAG